MICVVRYYTRGGDMGETSLYTGERIPKDSLRVEAYGTVDELQSFMGYARAIANNPEMNADILSIESMLVSVMAQLASTDGKLRVGVQDVSDIEAICDKYSSRIESRGFKFVLPGESVASAAFHVARTVARRCERCVIRYAKAEPVDEELLKYLNRISDVMYAMAICVDLEE